MQAQAKRGGSVAEAVLYQAQNQRALTVQAALLDARETGDGTVEVYRLVLEPGAEHHSVPHGAGVVEHLLLTRGRARVGRLGEEVEIVAGEAADWVSDVAHGYTALGEEPVESVLVIRSPGSSRPGRAAAVVPPTTGPDESAGE